MLPISRSARVADGEARAVGYSRFSISSSKGSRSPSLTTAVSHPPRPHGVFPHLPACCRRSRRGTASEALVRFTRRSRPRPIATTTPTIHAGLAQGVRAYFEGNGQGADRSMGRIPARPRRDRQRHAGLTARATIASRSV